MAIFDRGIWWALWQQLTNQTNHSSPESTPHTFLFSSSNQLSQLLLEARNAAAFISNFTAYAL